jgi:murein DD-endopeptidase / murein LD-carboxypeptidase
MGMILPFRLLKCKTPRLLLLTACLALLTLYSCKTPSKLADKHKQEHSNNDRSFYTTYSNKLGIKLNGSEDKKLIKEVSDWMGTPYKYGGEDRTGTDCSGFTSAVYEKIYNISLYRRSGEQVNNTEPVEKKDLKCGDLVFFSISGNKVSHVGLYIGDNKFVHASSKRGVCVNDLAEPYYTKHYYSAGRVKGLTSYK